jgi:hypothetical protein
VIGCTKVSLEHLIHDEKQSHGEYLSVAAWVFTTITAEGHPESGYGIEMVDEGGTVMFISDVLGRPRAEH